MLKVWQFTEQWITGALQGAAEPWIVCMVLAITTLLLEDLAIGAGAALATAGVISWELAFIAVGGGIAAGDMGLYGLGAVAHGVPWLRKKYVGNRSELVRGQLNDRLGTAVLIARVIPGLRFFTYVACGFVRVNLISFAFWVLIAVAAWTVGLFWISVQVGKSLSTAWGLPAPIAVALPIIGLAMALPLFRYLNKRSKRIPT